MTSAHAVPEDEHARAIDEVVVVESLESLAVDDHLLVKSNQSRRAAFAVADARLLHSDRHEAVFGKGLENGSDVVRSRKRKIDRAGVDALNPEEHRVAPRRFRLRHKRADPVP